MVRVASRGAGRWDAIWDAMRDTIWDTRPGLRHWRRVRPSSWRLRTLRVGGAAAGSCEAGGCEARPVATVERWPRSGAAYNETHIHHMTHAPQSTPRPGPQRGLYNRTRVSPWAALSAFLLIFFLHNFLVISVGEVAVIHMVVLTDIDSGGTRGVW